MLDGRFSLPNRSPILMTHLALLSLLAISSVHADIISTGYSQNFDLMVPTGWAVNNHNAPVGAFPNWYQGVDPSKNPLSFPAYDGTATAYAAASYLGTGSDGKIDTWLMSPEFNLKTGDTFSFFARQQGYLGSGNDRGYANAIQVRLSTSGASMDIGSVYGDFGAFLNLVLDVNPEFDLTGMPDEWTRYDFTYGGPDATGRVGFRFYTPDVSLYSSYIGIDAFETTATVVPEPSSIIIMSLGTLYMLHRRKRNSVQTSG